MATSEVDTANKALTHLKANRITSLSQETEEARICNTFFYSTLDEAVQDYPFDFAIARAMPARVSATPAYGYSYYFQMPTTPYCLQVEDVVDSNGNPVSDWEVEGRYIACNEETIYIRYIKRITNLNDLSPNFITAFSYLLASKMAYAITGSLNKETEMYSLYQAVMRRAKTRTSQQGAPSKTSDDKFDWLTAVYN
jgi:hypothetical protein